MKRLVVTAAAICLLIVLGAAGLWALESRESDRTGLAREEILTLDASTRATFLQVVDDHLQTAPERVGDTFLTDEKPELGPRTFCHEDLIEIRRKSANAYLVGVVATCEEFARSGDTLLSGTGFRSPLLVTLEAAKGRFEVRHVEETGDGSMNLPSIRAMFSPEGAPRAHELSGYGSPDLPEGTGDEARLAFGLPLTAKIVHP
ncbi:hypothetical protein AB0G15_35290 [Streptosporangium sp. NPDC023825]|uniref:hypothetical protein n=1 Tax=Streptosporangium sp. NPDC023825 TaxID=3154909 RepID=UPI003413FC77